MGQIGAYRALSIGASDVDGLPRRERRRLEQTRYATQAQLDHSSTEGTSVGLGDSIIIVMVNGYTHVVAYRIEAGCVD